MKKIKRIWARLKRLIKEIEVMDRMNNGKISNAIIAFCCFGLIGLVILYCLLFG